MRVVHEGPLKAKFYYIYAIDVDRNSVWVASTPCARKKKTFTIRGTDNSKERGFESSGFFEIDTGELNTWIVQL